MNSVRHILIVLLFASSLLAGTLDPTFSTCLPVTVKWNQPVESALDATFKGAGFVSTVSGQTLAGDYRSDGVSACAATWWGAYGQNEPDFSDIDTFTVSFYSANAGLPDTLITSYTGQAARIGAGVNQAGQNVYFYGAGLIGLFAELAGSDYFLSIVHTGHASWQWHSTPVFYGADPAAGPAWTPHPISSSTTNCLPAGRTTWRSSSGRPRSRAPGR